MASSNIDIIINAQDKTRDAFNKAQSGMSGFKDKVEGMKPTFQKMAVAGTAAFAAIGAFAVSALKESAAAAADMANANQTLENTLKGLSETMLGEVTEGGKSVASGLVYMKETMKQASDAALKLGFDDEAASQSFAKLFQTTKDTAEAHRELKIAMDLARDKGISLEEATQKLIMVHSGATKELKAQGLAIDENASAMENMALLEDSLTGKALAFASTTAGAWAVLQESTSNLKQAIGDALAPALQKLLELVQPLLEKFIAWAEQNPELLSKILLIGGAVAALVAVMGAIGLILPIIIAGFGLLLSPIGLLIITIGIIIFKWKEFKQMWIDAWEGIKGAAKAGADAIMGFLKPVFDFVNKIITAIDKAVSFVGDKVGGGSSKKKKVNDAVINPNGDVIETHPQDWVIATQNPGALFGGLGGGLVVNINGGTYLDEGVAGEIGDMILQRLQFNMRGS